MHSLTQQDYYDLGNDTERWWRECIKGLMPHLRHVPRCRGYDFKGEFEGAVVYVDCKFLRSTYRKKGWIEVKTWGKVTGIFDTAKTYFSNPDVEVYIAIMTEGRHYLVDAKALLREWQAGRLMMNEGTATDDRGNKTNCRHFEMDGWNDPRFCLIEGPMKTDLWKPTTPIGKLVNINAWTQGEWI